MVRDTRLWCSKSPDREIAGHPTAGKLCQTSSKWIPFFESGKDKAAKGERCAPVFLTIARNSVGI